MARNKTLSQSYALLVGPAPSTGVHGSDLRPVWGLQSLTWGQSNPKQDIQIMGKAAPIARESLEAPQITLSYSYYVTSTYNESNCLGFNCDGTTSALSNALSGDDDRNYFVFIAPEGTDAYTLSGASSGIRIFGLGNCFLNSYSIEGSVGNFPTASVQFQGLNIETYTGGVAQHLPSITSNGLLSVGESFTVPYIEDLTTGSLAVTNQMSRSILKPGDVTITLSDAGGIFEDYGNACVQSFRMNFDLNRNPINCFGSSYATSRYIQFPVNVNFEVEMLSKDISTGSLAQYICGTGKHTARVQMRLPSCNGSSTAEVLGFTLKNISLEDQNWNTSLGGEPTSLTTRWIGQIGAANDTVNGFFLSGSPD